MTHMLSNIFGIYMFCAGAGMLLNKHMARAIIEEFENSPALTYFGGAIIHIAGLFLIIHHNIWTGWPEILITLFGWGAAIEGAILLIYPKALWKLSYMLMPSEKIIPVFAIGIFLLGGSLIWA